MFGSYYTEWNKKRIKAILDFYTQKFFYRKSILELGCGFGDISGTLTRLGASADCLDARADHLKIVSKKFSNIKTIRADLDQPWALGAKKYDMILDLGVMCHLNDYKKHLKEVCSATDHLVLETYVADSEDENFSVPVKENKNIYDFSYNGNCNIPTASQIEKILNENGMSFKRFDDASLNVGNFKYDWQISGNQGANRNNRRLWFCVKDNSAIQFKAPEVKIISAPTYTPTVLPNYISPIPQPTISPITENYIKNQNIIKTKFVIVIPAYKTSNWCERNILSALNQNYKHFRVIFTDDCSPDDTFQKVKNVVDNHPNKNKATLLQNSERRGALYNLYHMIHSCDDNEVILTLDGDDWLDGTEVLNKLNQEYTSNDVWMTYGQFANYPDGSPGCSDKYPQHIIDNSLYRQDTWRASHLRTFYAWLFKSIKKEDLMDGDCFYKMAWDMLIQFPMLEMSGHRHKYVSDVLYVYNLNNDLNDHKIDRSLQARLDAVARSKEKYQKLLKPKFEKKKVGLLLIATNKYTKFLQQIITSADANFLHNEAYITYYIFSDNKIEINTKNKIVNIKVEHQTFPYASLNRFKYFTENKNKLKKEDYLYYCDVDSTFVGKIEMKDIVGDLVGVRHCGYINGGAEYETDQNSSLYINPNKYSYYFGGGFSGGKSKNYLKLSEWCYSKIEFELNNNRMPKWHDETAINRYFLDNEPDVILCPSYHYPQGNLEMYKNIWKGENFIPKILLLDKNHNEVRS